MLQTIEHSLSAASGFLWSYILLFCLLGTHIYLTIILRFPQRYFFTALKLYFAGSNKSEGHISHFSSLMISLAANVGTGNIIGVAVAVTTGGPGAVFWCMLTGLLGMSTRYAESLLSIRYRVQDEQGHIVGGPMYVIERGMKCRWLGITFAVLTAIAAFGIGNITQSNAVARVMQESALGIPGWASGAALALLVALVLLGGLKGISRVCSACVPSMALIYMVGCGMLLVANAEYIWPAIRLICTAAFTEQAAGGGFIGSCLMLAMQTGCKRGLFSNEAGMGSSPIVSAPVRTPNPVQQALVSSTGPFWDTVVICTLTGLTLTVAVMAHPSVDSEAGEVLTYHAFASMGGIGTLLLTISLATFVISTLLGWSYFGERALQYLGGVKLITPYRVLWVIMTFVGCIVPRSSLVWDFADIANGLMALPNLISLFALSGTLILYTRHYLWEHRLYKADQYPIPQIREQDREPLRDTP